MKKIIFLLVVIIAFSSMNAQGIIFGVKAGVNLGDSKSSISENNDTTGMRIGFHLGGVADVSITDQFAIQPELLYNSVGFKDEEGIEDLNYVIDYLSIPFLAKYYITEGFSLQAGPQVGFLIGAKKKIENDESDYTEKIESIDFGLAFGGAYKLYSGLSFDVRYVLGLSNTSAISTGDETMKNNVIQFSVGYMFQ